MMTVLSPKELLMTFVAGVVGGVVSLSSLGVIASLIPEKPQAAPVVIEAPRAEVLPPAPTEEELAKDREDSAKRRAELKANREAFAQSCAERNGSPVIGLDAFEAGEQRMIGCVLPAGVTAR